MSGVCTKREGIGPEGVGTLVESIEHAYSE